MKKLSILAITLAATIGATATDMKDLKITPVGQPQEANGWFNGNIVLVPKKVFAKIKKTVIIWIIRRLLEEEYVILQIATKG